MAGIWSEGDDSQCPHLFSLGTLGISFLNAASTIHLFSVEWQMGSWQMSPQALLKCISEKGNFNMLTGREGQCFNARAYLLLFLKTL